MKWPDDYINKVIRGFDMAYLFGEWPQSLPGRRIVGGETINITGTYVRVDHPCPRRISHVQYLVNKYSDKDDIIFDPFLGSGTTAVAAVQAGRKFIGIELDPGYCEIARERIAQASEQQDLFRKPVVDVQDTLL